MRDTGHEYTSEIVIPSDPAEARGVQEDIERRLRALDFDDRDIFSIKLALEEALVNAIKHGNQLDRTKKVHITYDITADRFAISITDEGPGFDPEDVPDPMAVENLERPCGRGLLLIRHYMTDVVFHPPGNRMTMSKVRNRNGVHRNGKK